MIFLKMNPVSAMRAEGAHLGDGRIAEKTHLKLLTNRRCMLATSVMSHAVILQTYLRLLHTE